ncbi:MAG: ABC transporter substrate-binding protein [Dongiaceae bacterium]
MAALSLIAGAPGPGTAADKLTVAVNKFASGAPLYIAQAKGYFREEGFEVTFLHSTSAQTLGLAIASGDAALGLTALTAGIYTLADKGGLKMVAGGLEERPGYKVNAIVVNQAVFNRGVRSLPDFVGLRIGASQVGSPQENQWARIARKFGFKYSDLQIIPLQTIPNILSSLRGGQVDAAALPATLALQLQRSGGAHIIAWMGDVVPSQFGVITVNASVMRRDPDTVVRFLRVYLKAIAYYDRAFQQPGPDARPVKGSDHAEALQIIASYLEQPTDQVEAGLSYFNPDATLSINDLDEQIEVWKSLKQVSPAMSSQNLVETALLQKAKATTRR